MNPLLPHERSYYTTTTTKLHFPKYSPQPLDRPFVHYQDDPVIVNGQCFDNLYTKRSPNVKLEPFHPIALTSTRMKEKYATLRGKIGGLNKCLKRNFFKGEINDETMHEIRNDCANRTEYLVKFGRPNENIYSTSKVGRDIMTGKDKITAPNSTWINPNNSLMRVC